MAEVLVIPREKTYSRKRQNAWAFYDWANSVYSLVIATAIFPIYFESVTSSEIGFLGMQFQNTAFYSYTLSFSFLVVAFISPILSGLADHIGNKRAFLKFFCYLGASACMVLAFFTGENNVWIAIVGSMLASIGFWGSLVFYNAFLPEIAPPEKHDHLSAKGFALGYLGSSFLLIFNLLMIQKPEWFGLADAGQASRISFFTVGLWWAGFAQITFARLPRRTGKKISPKGYIWTGYKQLRKVAKQLKGMPHIILFLLAFFAFSVGVQTTILMASLFGSQELGLDSGKLILTILIIQFIGILGAYTFSYLSARISNIPTLMILVLLWIVVCVGAFMLRAENPYVEWGFFGLGGLVGLVMGGIQSLSRSTFSKMLPETLNTASFFSFYDVTEKIAIVSGTFSFALAIQLTGNMRQSTLVLAVFFAIAFFLLIFLRLKYRSVMVLKAERKK